MLKTTILLALTALAPAALAHDPVASDGDKYKVLLENDQVRVLAYVDRPGDRTHEHRHPAFVVVALAPFKRRLLLGDGRTLVREFKAGEVIYSPGEMHVGENIGTTPTQVIMVELKQALGRTAGSP
jgi:quercetin dioxygenase-like cupin family protein